MMTVRISLNTQIHCMGKMKSFLNVTADGVSTCSYHRACILMVMIIKMFCTSQMQLFILLVPRGLRRRSAAARLLRLWLRIPPGAWMSACCECCVLLGRGLCNELIPRPEESYRLWCIVECDLETS
jgi:hypothetical protein